MESLIRNYPFVNVNKTIGATFQQLPCYQYQLELYSRSFEFVAEYNN